MKQSLSEEFYRSLFENSLDGLAYCQMIFDKKENPVDFEYILVNKNFESLTGLKNVVGKKVSEIIPGIATTNPEVFKTYGRVSLTGKPERFETYIDLLQRWFYISVYSPQKTYFTAVFQNITVRKQIEKKLENATIAARNVLEDLSLEKAKVELARAKEEAALLSIGDGLFATDEKGYIILINKTAERLLGKTSEEVIGKFFSDAIICEDEMGMPLSLEKRPVHIAMTTGVTTSSTTSGPSYYYRKKDKAKFPAAIMVTPVILGGKVTGTIEVFRDITREKEIDKAKNEFVSLASHQLRTPTTAVNWYSEMLGGEEVGVLNEKQKEYINEIHHSNQRMIELVNTLLSVSRIELGTFAIQPGPTNFATIAQDVVKELQSLIREKKLQIINSYARDIPIIDSDRKLLRIVFQNLLSNAVAYTPEKGTIKIKIKKTNTGIQTEIADTGCGIPQKARTKIYTKFFRADNARLLKPDGTGLGLYITKSIVEALGGTIRFAPNVGGGTVFSVTIPNHGIAQRVSKKTLT